MLIVEPGDPRAPGPRAGQEVMRFGDRIDPDRLDDTPTPRCARVDGMSLHADVAVPACDRARLAEQSEDPGADHRADAERA